MWLTFIAPSSHYRTLYGMSNIALLWRHERPAPARRGRPPSLSVDAIVAEAVALADRDGLAAVSMRALAERLGAAPMSIYTHVPGRAELVELMVDEVLGEVVGADPPRGGWRARLEAVAHENAALLCRHPWLVDATAVRPPLGPNTIAKYDRELRTVEGIGLDDVEMDSVLTLVIGFVHAQIGAELEAARAAERSGMTDDAWWEEQAGELAEVLDPERFPVAVRVGQAASDAYAGLWDPEHAFEFGLARVLDGVEALVRQRSTK
jgi:AcrR family transcriptional regulator